MIVKTTFDALVARVTTLETAIPATWVTPTTSSNTYSAAVNTTAFTDLPGYSALSITVPAGRTLELDYAAPKVTSPSGIIVRLQLVADGVALDGAEQTSSSAQVVVPIRLGGSVVGTGAAVIVSVQAFASGAGAAVGATTNRGPRLRYRIV